MIARPTGRDIEGGQQPRHVGRAASEQDPAAVAALRIETLPDPALKNGGAGRGADGNFVLTSKGAIVEVQATAEGAVFEEETLLRLLRLARIGTDQIFAAQRTATGR